MTDVEFVREYFARLPVKLKKYTDMQVRSIVNGKKIPLSEMLNDETLNQLSLSHIELFVYKYCRDNQTLFERRYYSGTMEYN